MKSNEKAPAVCGNGRDSKNTIRAGLMSNSIANFPPREKLTLLFSINGRTLCQAQYRLAADTRSVELPFPVIQMLSRS